MAQNGLCRWKDGGVSCDGFFFPEEIKVLSLAVGSEGQNSKEIG